MAGLGGRVPGGRDAGRDDRGSGASTLAEEAQAAVPPAMPGASADEGGDGGAGPGVSDRRAPTTTEPADPVAEPPDPAADRDESGPVPTFRGFLGWGAAAYLLVTGLIVVLSFRVTGGRIVYVLDDPAIHLSVARNLADHGTWGAVAGHYESASSSPLWTLILAAGSKVFPGKDEPLPLLLNIVAGLGVIAVFAAGQTILAPSRRRPADALAVVAFVVVILFLPGLALVGMEHTLHVALILGAVILFHRDERGLARWGPRWLPYVVLGLATLTRFESAFVAFALALAFLLAPAQEGTSPARRLVKPLLVGLSSLVPLVGYGVANRAMGQGWLPNSVLAKSTVQNDTGLEYLHTAFLRLNSDPLVAASVALAVVALLLAGRRWTAYSLPAIVTIVTVTIHALVARFGWYERYQAYLVAIGAYALFTILADRLPAVRLPPARSFAVAGIVGSLLLLSSNKPGLTTGAADGAAQTYEQRYQVGRFMGRYYQGEPIATGELGYISLFHDGPLTDVFGLGDHEVLEAWQEADRVPPPEFWSRLADERGFGVVAVYPLSIFPNVPADWITVGTWTLAREVTTAPENSFVFLAADPEAVAPLVAHLNEFEAELPDGVATQVNPLAEYQADLVMAGESPTGGPPPAATGPAPAPEAGPGPDTASGT